MNKPIRIATGCKYVDIDGYCVDYFNACEAGIVSNFAQAIRDDIKIEKVGVLPEVIGQMVLLSAQKFDRNVAAAVFADGNSHAGAGSEGEAEEPVSGSAAAGMTEDDTDGTSGDGAAAGDAEDDPDHTLGAGHYDRATILRWLKIFYRRFFAQQFKRSCLPDGPKVGTVAVSPRGNLRMPSDASARIWLEELEELGEA